MKLVKKYVVIPVNDDGSALDLPTETSTMLMLDCIRKGHRACRGHAPISYEDALRIMTSLMSKFEIIEKSHGETK